MPQKITRSQWNGADDNWIKSSHPFAFEVNNKILEKKTTAIDLIKRSYMFNKPPSFQTFFSVMTRKGDRNSFYEFIQRYIDRPPEKLEENTLKKYRTALSHLKKCRPHLQFVGIDSKMVSYFHQYMQNELGLEGAACKKYMEAFTYDKNGSGYWTQAIRSF
ncbi:MAG: phage integrase SAM-like domain-containing protein [Chitinophagaceae bacterium]